MNDIMNHKDYKKLFRVQHRHLANVIKSGTSPVLSSPSLLAFIEDTCMESITPILNSPLNNKNTCVGVKSDFYHLKPSVEGDKIECQSKLIFIEKNRKLHFKIEVYKEGTDTLIANCDHIRYLVPENFYKLIK